MGDIFWKTVAESAIWSDVLNKVGDNAISFEGTTNNLVVEPFDFIVKKNRFSKLVASLPKTDTLHCPKFSLPFPFP